QSLTHHTLHPPSPPPHPTYPLFFLKPRRPPTPTLFPYTTLFRSRRMAEPGKSPRDDSVAPPTPRPGGLAARARAIPPGRGVGGRSEEHTSELQSLTNLVCRLLLEKKKKSTSRRASTTNASTCDPRTTRTRMTGK